MASRNADSMTNAQGEFHPSKPRDEPMTTKGHQIGQQVGNDAAPEFNAKVLPPGSAPKGSTFQPNPIDEVPGQANNDDVERGHGKEGVKVDPLDMPGATSGDVHRGLGKPIQGQTSTELHHDAKAGIELNRSGDKDSGATGGSGLTGNESTEARRLQEEHTQRGPLAARDNTASLEGAESKEPTSAEQLASEEKTVMQGDYLRRGEKGSGNVNTKQ